MKVEPLKAPNVVSGGAIIATGRNEREHVITARIEGIRAELVDAEVVGVAVLTTTGGTQRMAIVVRRRRPFIPLGTDPTHINKECARSFALVESEVGFDLVEVTP